MQVQHGPLQIRAHTRILTITPEAILQIAVITSEEAIPHRDILLLLSNRGRIPTEAAEVIQFLPGAAWNDQVILQDHMVVLPLRAAADHPLLTAEVQDQEVHTLPDPHLRVLHQVVVLLQVVVALLQEEDSF
jgi:hypothetical protein